MWRFVFALLTSLVMGVSATGDTQPGFDPDLRDLLTEAISDATSFEDRFHAEVWLKDMSNRLLRQVPDHGERLHILKRVHQEAGKVGIPPELVLAVIDVESNFDRYAISTAGARGLMQVMPFWLKEIGRPNDNLFEINTNLRMGCTILKFYLDKEDGNLVKALARYNGSVGRRVYPDKVLRKLSEKWFRE